MFLWGRLKFIHRIIVIFSLIILYFIKNHNKNKIIKYKLFKEQVQLGFQANNLNNNHSLTFNVCENQSYNYINIIILIYINTSCELHENHAITDWINSKSKEHLSFSIRTTNLLIIFVCNIKPASNQSIKMQSCHPHKLYAWCLNRKDKRLMTEMANGWIVWHLIALLK